MERILYTVKFLSTPFEPEHEIKSRKVPAESPSLLLDSLLNASLENVQLTDFSLNKEYIENAEISPTWKYSCLILEVLAQLKLEIEKTEETMSEAERSIEALSLQSQIYVQKCVELVVGFGILPYLFPGVGMPEKLRKVNINSHLFILEDKNIQELEKFFRLAHAVKSLLFLCNHHSFTSIILQKYTCDILSSLLQLCKSPLKKPLPCPCDSPDSSKDIEPLKSDCKVAVVQNPGLTFEEYSRVLCERDQLNNLLHKQFLTSSPKGALVNSLLLIGAAVRPRWIGKACSEILSSLLLSSEKTGTGFFTISQAILESLGRSSVWKVSRVISNLLREAVRLNNEIGDVKLLQSRLINISTQAYNMVRTLGQNSSENMGYETTDTTKVHENKEQLTIIALTSALTLHNIDPLTIQNSFWHRLFDPLLKLSRAPTTAENANPQLSVSIKELETCVFYAGKLLVLSPAIDFPFPLRSFLPIYSLLFQIFSTFESYLKRKVQDPQITEIIQLQHQKLQDVLITMFEVLNSLSEAHTSPSPVVTSTRASDSSNMLSKFCLQLLLNDNPVPEELLRREEEGADLNFKINRVCFDISECLETEMESEMQPTPSSKTNNKLNVEAVKIVRLNPSTVEENTMELVSEDCATLCSGVLKNERIRKVSGKIFCQLLQYADKADENPNENPSPSPMSTPAPAQKSSEESVVLSSRVLKDLDVKERIGCEKCIAMKLLSDLGSDDSIIEDMGVIENPEQTLHFLELIIKKLTLEMESSSRTGDEYEFGQSVLFSLGILGTMCEAMRESELTMASKIGKEALMDSSWEDLQRFLPYLRQFQQTPHGGMISAGIPQMAEDIMLLIETKGGGHAGKTKVRKTRFESALENVANPMLPIKGHGLLELRKLLEERNEDVLKREELLLQIFQREIKNEDSYVYLMAIQGMATLGLKFHSVVVPILIQEYGNYDTTTSSKVVKSMRTEERAEFRMKIGEAVVKIVQRLGEISPIYRVPITNVCFHLVRDDDSLIRASALSNLGELCHLLKFSLGAILTEVWQCVETLLVLEKQVEVRRAALHLIVLLLRGVEKDFTTKLILEDPEIGRYLRDARRLLTRLLETEVDAVARIHSQLALRELELIVGKLLTPSNNLEFNVRVLNTS